VTVQALLRREATSTPQLLAASVIASACFGAAVGCYTGGPQIAYAAIKMPIYFLGTLGLSFSAMHVFAARDLRASETFAVALETVALTTVVLGTFAPIDALASLSVPKPSRRGYSFLVLLLTVCVGAAGVCGVARAYRRLGSVKLTAGWVLLYQFVGAQMAWLLRPWVNDGRSGTPFLPLRENLSGSFYEAVLRAFRELLF
jgi:hypothetical protein